MPNDKEALADLDRVVTLADSSKSGVFFSCPNSTGDYHRREGRVAETRLVNRRLSPEEGLLARRSPTLAVPRQSVV